MSALPDEDMLMAFLDFQELDRLYAVADAQDEVVRTGWIEQRNERLIAKYGSLRDAEDVYARDDYEPEPEEEF